MPKRLELLHHFLRQYYNAVKTLKMYKKTLKIPKIRVITPFS